MPKQISIEDALDYCLLNPANLSTKELLDRFPEYREQIEPLLALAADLKTIPTPHVPAERRAARKERLVAAAATRQAQRPLPVTRPVPNLGPGSNILAWVMALPPIVWAGALALILTVALVWPAAAQSLPDSPLYYVKLASERLVVSITPNAADRLRTHTSIANARLDDVQTMSAQGKVDKMGAALDNYSEHIANSIAALKEFQGSEQAELAKLVYASTTAGGRIFESLKNAPGLQTATMESIKSTLKSANTHNQEVVQVLTSAGIDPTTLPTRVLEIAIPTPPSGTQVAAMGTATQVQAQASQTGNPTPGALGTGEPTEVAVAATSTQIAISPQTSATPANPKTAVAGNQQTNVVPTPVIVAPSTQSKASVSPIITGSPSPLVSPTASRISTGIVTVTHVPPTYTRTRIPSPTSTRVIPKLTPSPSPTVTSTPSSPTPPNIPTITPVLPTLTNILAATNIPLTSTPISIPLGDPAH